MSIAASGVIQPILVRPVRSAAPRYETVAGERRWWAAKLAALTDIPVVVRERWMAERKLSMRATEAWVCKTLHGKGRAAAPEYTRSTDRTRAETLQPSRNAT